MHCQFFGHFWPPNWAGSGAQLDVDHVWWFQWSHWVLTWHYGILWPCWDDYLFTLLCRLAATANQPTVREELQLKSNWVPCMQLYTWTVALTYDTHFATFSPFLATGGPKSVKKICAGGLKWELCFMPFPSKWDINYPQIKLCISRGGKSIVYYSLSLEYISIGVWKARWCQRRVDPHGKQNQT